MSERYENEPSPSTPEREPNQIIQQFFSDISHPETAGKITAESIAHLSSQMRTELDAVGIDFNLLSTEAMQTLLTERQFQTLNQGKGLAIALALDGQTPPPIEPLSCLHVLAFRQWAQGQSKDLPRLGSKSEYSRRRGLEQLLANTIAFAAGALSPEDYLRDLKWRVGASYERPLKDATETENDASKKDTLRKALAETRQAYSIPTPQDKELREKYSGYSRITPESVSMFWGQLLDIMTTTPQKLSEQWSSLKPEEQSLYLGNDKQKNN